MKNNNEKKGSNIILVIVFVIIIIMLMGLAIRPLLQRNELIAQRDEYKEKYEEKKQENDKLEYEKNLPLDEENIKNIAKDKLDLVDPKDEFYIGD